MLSQGDVGIVLTEADCGGRHPRCVLLSLGCGQLLVIARICTPSGLGVHIRAMTRTWPHPSESKTQRGCLPPQSASVRTMPTSPCDSIAENPTACAAP